MAEEKPTAPADAVTSESVADSPTNTNTESAQAPEQKAAEQPDMHGFTSEQLADMKKFFDNAGGYERVKSRISNPEKYQEKTAEKTEEKPAEQQPVGNTDKLGEQPQQPTTPPKGAITADEMMAKYYFEQLSKQEKYEPIAKQIADGSLLAEMKSLGIEIRNPDGSFNDAKINTYLGIKAQTVPAKQNTTSPAEGSAAPTVDWADVGEKITSAEQAYKVITQPGHPKTADAEAFLKEMFNKKP